MLNVHTDWSWKLRSDDLIPFPYSLHLPLSYYPITLHRITLGKNSRWLVVAFQLIISVIHSVFHLSCSCTCSSLHLSLFIILTEFVIPLYSQSRLTKNKSRLQFSFLSLQCTKLPLVYRAFEKKKIKIAQFTWREWFFFCFTFSHTQTCDIIESVSFSI